MTEPQRVTIYSAAYDRSLLYALDFRRLAQRADKIGYAVALLKRGQLHGCAAHYLKYNGNRSRLCVIIRNGKRYTLPFVVHS